MHSEPLSAVSERLLQVSITELTYSSQVYQRLLHFIDLAVSSEIHLRMCVCVAVLSDGNWLPSYVVDVLVNERQRVVDSHS